ncbi:hypothetical protein P3T76_007706 [Phytophthora citrophthora]|uniref:Uncharacterized protein n=1 Tax=Phytophthora citrophthora TaxID=4793 RepID=A0AAD9LLH9_9STRA|nr:hypothetical protein P3T76_007706 [Phytophthora citrophthora]
MNNRKAFTETEYIGNADVEFGKYLRRLWSYESIARSIAPCVAVTQRSGFGKSRMIWELALKASDDKEMNMKVLYLCVRKELWTGYPEATIQLYDWLFRSRHTSISQQLKKIYYYAITHWDTVQSEWQELFTNTNAADRVLQALTKVAVKNRKWWYIGNEGGIFGVLVDTNPLISNPSTMDANWKGYCRDVLRRSSSSREEEKKEDGETVVNEEEAEVSMEDQVAVYKRLVTRRKRRKAFDALRRMGRPMWHSIYSNWTLMDPITIAACKLKMGLNLINSVRTNFTEEAIHRLSFHDQVANGQYR